MSKAKYISKLVDASGSTTSANVSYTGTLTGSTGILNIGSGQLYKDASGNVGIGTSSPSAKLQIGDSTVNIGNRLIFGRSVTCSESHFPLISHYSDGSTSDLALVATSTSGKIRFFTGNSANQGEIATGTNTEKMSIDSSGNVGIGTSNPLAKLDVSSTTLSEIRATISSVGAGNVARLALKSPVASYAWYVADNANALVLYDYNATTERMRIDSSGRITKPYQPAFKAYASTSVSNYTTGGTKITAYDTTTFNIGGHYSTVNKRFTAPIAGVYMFAARAWATGGNTTGAGINITVNGASVIATIRIATSPGDYTTMNPFTEVYLNANDYVEVFTETCTSTGQVHISTGEAYSGFTGYFLG